MAVQPRLAKLGQLFVRAGLLDPQRLSSVVAHAEQNGTSFGRAMVDLGLATEEEFVASLAKVASLPAVELASVTPPAQVLALLDAATCKEHGVVPFGVADGGRTLLVAVSDPTDVQALDQVSVRAGLRLKQHLAGERAIQAAIRRWYYGESGAVGDTSEFKLLDRAGQTLHPHEPTPQAAAAAANESLEQQVQALRSALEAQEKMVRALMDALLQKQLLTAEDLLRARRPAQPK